MCQILKDEAKVYWAANGSDKNKVIASIKAKLQEEAKTTGKFLPENVDKVI